MAVLTHPPNGFLQSLEKEAAKRELDRTNEFPSNRAEAVVALVPCSLNPVAASLALLLLLTFQISNPFALSPFP